MFYDINKIIKNLEWFHFDLFIRIRFVRSIPYFEIKIERYLIENNRKRKLELNTNIRHGLNMNEKKKLK